MTSTRRWILIATGIAIAYLIIPSSRDRATRSERLKSVPIPATRQAEPTQQRSRERPHSARNGLGSAPQPPPGFEFAPPDFWPDAVEALAEEARQRCHSADVEVVVECEEYPCLVMTLAMDGVRAPFCAEMEHAPRFPPNAARSPIDLRSRKFTFAQPMVVEEHLEEEEVREQIRIRSERLAVEWFRGSEPSSRGPPRCSRRDRQS